MYMYFFFTHTKTYRTHVDDASVLSHGGRRHAAVIYAQKITISVCVYGTRNETNSRKYECEKNK